MISAPLFLALFDFVVVNRLAANRLLCFPESQTRLDLVDQDVSNYKSVRFSLFFLGIEAQKRVLRPFELLVNISAIITENWGLCYKKHKRGWRRIPSKKIVSFLVFLLKETRKPPSFFQSFDEIQAIIRGSNGPSLYGIYMKFEKKTRSLKWMDFLWISLCFGDKRMCFSTFSMTKTTKRWGFSTRSSL